jgi:hypothetical protein
MLDVGAASSWKAEESPWTKFASSAPKGMESDDYSVIPKRR